MCIQFSVRAFRIKMHIGGYEVTICIRINNRTESVRCVFMTANSMTCQKCGSPVTPGMKFCESCGAKIEVSPACPQCGAALVPNVKFCENCGAPVSPAAVPMKATPEKTAPVIAMVTAPLPPLPETPPVQKVKPPAEPLVKVEEKTAPVIAMVTAPLPPLPETPPVQKVKPPAEPPVTVEEKTAPVVAPVTAPLPPLPETPPAQKVKPPAEPPVTVEEKTAPVPEEKPAPAPAPVKVPPKTEKAKDVPKETGPKKPIPQQTMVIAGIIVLALLGALVYFVVLPMISGPAATSQNQQAPMVTMGPVSSSATQATQAGTSQAATVSFTPGPTQVPPSNRVVILDAERDPISSIVSVTFKGGEGQYGVSQIMVTLTRSDGSSETKSFKPDTIGSGVTFQGTPKTDRLEATSYFFSGEQYKIIDQIFEYKKRSG
jgi:uncharacterized OB-fold protein